MDENHLFRTNLDTLVLCIYIYIPLLTGHLGKYGDDGGRDDDDGGDDDLRDGGDDDDGDTKGYSLICLLLHAS